MTTRQAIFDYLNSLPPPQAVEFLTFEEIRAENIETMQQTMLALGYAWEPQPDDPMYKHIENDSFREYLLRESVNHKWRQATLRYSEGSNLRQIGFTNGGVEQRVGESDTDYRIRIPLELAALSAGTKASIRSNAELTEDAMGNSLGVVDVSLVEAVTLQGVAIKVYCAKANAIELTDAERVLVEANLNHSFNLHIGDTATVPATTESLYTVACDISYNSGESDRVALEAVLRTSVYAAIDAFAKIGLVVDKGIFDASYKIAGVSSFNSTLPAADIVGVEGQINRCVKDETNVVFTFTDTA